MVASTPETLTGVIERQPEVARMVRNGWVRLICVDPSTAKASIYIEGKGFVPAGHGDARPVETKTAARSAEWYLGHMGNLTPALLVPSANGEASRAV